MQIVESHNGMKAILELDDNEKKWWRKKIKQVKNRHVLSSKDLINNHFAGLKSAGDITEDVKSTSSFIKSVRDVTWDQYIESELRFYKEVVKELLTDRPFPHEVLESLLTEGTIKTLRVDADREQLIENIAAVFGDFTGRIFPYFYELSKSVTQGNRSRAGNAFEAIIHNIMDAYEYPYEDQKSIGKKTFEAKGMGKIVDGLVPGLSGYDHARAKCLILTLKTTLRERWQEVVEELNRTNVPSIHLLTLDEDVTDNTLLVMKNHNITLVTYDDVKDKFPTHTNVISFETLFNDEIPHTLEWWKNVTL